MHPLFYEHTSCEDAGKQLIHNLMSEDPEFKFVGPPEYMKPPVHLGIDGQFNASYYIGADWLQTNQLAAVVLPKVPNLDYVEMFIEALNVNSAAETDYFSKCYGIKFDQPAIEVTDKLNQLSILLLVRYIVLLEKMVARGIRKDYITVEENLKSKVKGHLVMSVHLNKNVIPHREDRAYCRYQVYTEDIPVNRLLKKALLFAQQMLFSIPSLSKICHKLQPRLNVLLMRFEQISDNVSITEVRTLAGNKLYRQYTDVVQAAKDILRRYDYSLSEVADTSHKTPPFWIDMARLFELYVYGKLYAVYGNQIKFQVPGYLRTQADFIHLGERLVIDTKYKPRYDYSMSGIIADIREISGYARDTKILKHFKDSCLTTNEELNCLIIYPVTCFEEPDSDKIDDVEMSLEEQKELKDFIASNIQEPLSNSLWSSATPLPWFRNFRKLSVRLPTISHLN